MKRHSLIAICALTTTLAGAGNGAQAAPSAALEFDTTSEVQYFLKSSNTILAAATATCPGDGYLVATANARFQRINGGGIVNAAANFGIRKLGGLVDPGYKEQRVGTEISDDNTINLFWQTMGTVQRVDPCTEGSMVTFTFVARNDPAYPGTVGAVYPTLIVQYFRDRI